MGYQDLTTEEKKVLDDYANFIRPLAGEVARAFNHVTAAIHAYHSQVDDALRKLQPTDTIPNTSGLAGAGTIDKQSIESFLANLKQAKLAFDNDANREMWAQFAGAQNTIG